MKPLYNLPLIAGLILELSMASAAEGVHLMFAVTMPMSGPKAIDWSEARIAKGSIQQLNKEHESFKKEPKDRYRSIKEWQDMKVVILRFSWIENAVYHDTKVRLLVRPREAIKFSIDGKDYEFASIEAIVQQFGKDEEEFESELRDWGGPGESATAGQGTSNLKPSNPRSRTRRPS